MKACQASGRENDRSAPDINQGGEELQQNQDSSLLFFSKNVNLLAK